ncbi:HIT family protein [Pinisolibacter sp.]|uniref:HIT family protein n=1 Tax=Pinisolibacter sp. TaxID=2172024 RepID=UPI002FDD0C57
MTAFQLDPRLAADTEPLLDLPLSSLLLMRDGNYPWLILVPRRAGAVEILDLPAADRAQLWAEIERVAEALRAETGADKLNVAALGNVVAQLHVHVIARFRTDAAWPAPVWGKVPAIPLDAARTAALVTGLKARLGAV